MLNRNEIVSRLREIILKNERCTNAKDYEFLGRALVGCEMITVNNDGSITNGYGIMTSRNCNGTWRAKEIIEDAIKELTKNV